MSKRPSLGLLSGGLKKPSPVEPAPTELAAEPVQTTARTSKPTKAVPSWQVGKRAVTVWVDEEQYRRLNEASFESRKPVRRLVFEALNLLLPAYDKLPVEDHEEP